MIFHLLFVKIAGNSIVVSYFTVYNYQHLMQEDCNRCGERKILLDNIFVKYCWKRHRDLKFSAVQLPAFDILFVLYCEKTSTVYAVRVKYC